MLFRHFFKLILAASLLSGMTELHCMQTQDNKKNDPRIIVQVIDQNGNTIEKIDLEKDLNKKTLYNNCLSYTAMTGTISCIILAIYHLIEKNPAMAAPALFTAIPLGMVTAITQEEKREIVKYTDIFLKEKEKIQNSRTKK